MNLQFSRLQRTHCCVTCVFFTFPGSHYHSQYATEVQGQSRHCRLSRSISPSLCNHHRYQSRAVSQSTLFPKPSCWEWTAILPAAKRKISGKARYLR